MKRSFLALLCIAIAVSASGQANSILLIGNFSANTSTANDPGSDKNVRNTLGVTPGIGYQFSDHWTAGIALSYTYSSQDESTPSSGVHDKSHNTGLGGGLFARYTVPLSSLLFFYGQAQGVYTTSKSYVNGMEQSGTVNNNFNLTLSPGIGMNISHGFALNFGFGSIVYRDSKNPSTKVTNSSLGTTFGQALSFGITKNFGGSKAKTEAPKQQ